SKVDSISTRRRNRTLAAPATTRNSANLANPDQPPKGWRASVATTHANAMSGTDTLSFSPSALAVIAAHVPRSPGGVLTDAEPTLARTPRRPARGYPAAAATRGGRGAAPRALVRHLQHRHRGIPKRSVVHTGRAAECVDRPPSTA